MQIDDSPVVNLSGRTTLSIFCKVEIIIQIIHDKFNSFKGNKLIMSQ